MIKFYDVLKSEKTGLSNSLFTSLLAKKLSGSPAPTVKELEGVPPLSFTANGEPLISLIVKGKMVAGTPSVETPDIPGECGDLVLTGEHSGEYIIPITNGSITTPIYLTEPLRQIGESSDYRSESSEYRAIKKLVFTGQEPNWTYESTYERFGIAITDMAVTETRRTTVICSHYTCVDDGRQISDVPNDSIYAGKSSPNKLFIKTDSYTSATDFKTYLQQQYSNGTPVCVWYVLTSPVTTTAAALSVPTTKGSNTLSVGTTVQPSSVYIKYKE